MARSAQISAVAAALLAVVAPLAGALGSGTASDVRAVAVQIVVPGARTSAAGVDSSGSYTYRDLVTVGSFNGSTVAGSDRTSATVNASSISVMAGLITASNASSAATAMQSNGTASGNLAGDVSGLTVGGVSIPDGINARFDLPDGLGWGVANERVVASPSSRTAYRGYGIALHIHLAVGWHDMPAGTKILIGYADAGITATSPPATTTQASPPSTTSASPSTPSTPAQQPEARGGPSTPVGNTTTQAGASALPSFAPLGQPPSTPGPAQDTEAPPPGGFTLDPPIAPSVKAALLGPGYVFPVAGGASFTNDFGAPRADTGFHQGIDLFAPLGTPIVAVHDGTLLAVGWNQLGGRRLWLQDEAGNMFYYAHMSAYAPVAKDGAKVKAGEIIGFVGNSGDAQGTPYHCHFEIHPGGAWAVPPFDYVSAWDGRAVPFAHQLSELSKPTAQARPAPEPVAPLVELGAHDISSASGLEPNAVVTAASTAPSGLSEGDGALIGGAPTPTPTQVVTGPAPGLPTG